MLAFLLASQINDYFSTQNQLIYNFHYISNHSYLLQSNNFIQVKNRDTLLKIQISNNSIILTVNKISLHNNVFQQAILYNNNDKTYLQIDNQKFVLADSISQIDALTELIQVIPHTILSFEIAQNSLFNQSIFQGFSEVFFTQSADCQKVKLNLLCVFDVPGDQFLEISALKQGQNTSIQLKFTVLERQNVIQRMLQEPPKMVNEVVLEENFGFLIEGIHCASNQYQIVQIGEVLHVYYNQTLITSSEIAYTSYASEINFYDSNGVVIFTISDIICTENLPILQTTIPSQKLQILISEFIIINLPESFELVDFSAKNVTLQCVSSQCLVNCSMQTIVLAQNFQAFFIFKTSFGMSKSTVSGVVSSENIIENMLNLTVQPGNSIVFPLVRSVANYSVLDVNECVNFVQFLYCQFDEPQQFLMTVMVFGAEFQVEIKVEIDSNGNKRLQSFQYEQGIVQQDVIEEVVVYQVDKFDWEVVGVMGCFGVLGIFVMVVGGIIIFMSKK